MSMAAALKLEIEAKLASRIPAALSPLVREAPQLQRTGIAAVDSLLGGGLPLGSVCELSGAASTGRTSLALSLLAQVSATGACAYVDVGDTLHPHSAAAAGVRLENLLWVRFAEAAIMLPAPAAASPWAAGGNMASLGPCVSSDDSGYPSAGKRPLQGGGGGAHPRTETRGLAPALEEMLAARGERRLQKMEGTPGYPNQPIIWRQKGAQKPDRDQKAGLGRGLGQKMGLGTASQEQVDWERFNCRKPDEEDPLRVANQQSAAAARAGLLGSRERGCDSSGNKGEMGSRTGGAPVAAWPMTRSEGEGGARQQEKRERRPWSRLDAALRATDQVLQAGGFRVVVLDMASLRAEEALRVPSATWWRYRRAVQGSDALLLLLTQEACARSSAACVLLCGGAGSALTVNGILSGASFQAEVARQRTGAMPGKMSPGRVAGWQAAPTWMRAAGR